ncbi:unnamed protein product [Lampetra planeri]
MVIIIIIIIIIVTMTIISRDQRHGEQPVVLNLALGRTFRLGQSADLNRSDEARRSVARVPFVPAASNSKLGDNRRCRPHSVPRENHVRAACTVVLLGTAMPGRVAVGVVTVAVGGVRCVVGVVTVAVGGALLTRPCRLR